MEEKKSKGGNYLPGRDELLSRKNCMPARKSQKPQSNNSEQQNSSDQGFLPYEYKLYVQLSMVFQCFVPTCSSILASAAVDYAETKAQDSKTALVLLRVKQVINSGVTAAIVKYLEASKNYAGASQSTGGQVSQAYETFQQSIITDASDFTNKVENALAILYYNHKSKQDNTAQYQENIHFIACRLARFSSNVTVSHFLSCLADNNEALSTQINPQAWVDLVLKLVVAKFSSLFQSNSQLQ